MFSTVTVTREVTDKRHVHIESLVRTRAVDRQDRGTLKILGQTATIRIGGRWPGVFTLAARLLPSGTVTLFKKSGRSLERIEGLT
jgi:hypothetical protein